MWRLFQWLDGHEPNFFKFSVMLAGLVTLAGASFLLGQINPAIGVVFGFGMIFALWWFSIDYRFNRKPKGEPQSKRSVDEASESEVLRRYRRAMKTAYWRRRILALEHADGKMGEYARAIIAGWRDAEAAQAKSRLRNALEGSGPDEAQPAGKVAVDEQLEDDKPRF